MKKLAKIISNVLSGAFLSFSLLSFPQEACAQQYGARLFWLSPSDINFFLFSVLYTNSNTTFDTSVILSDLNVESFAVVPNYVRNFKLGNRSAQFSLAVPFAWANVELNANSRSFERDASGLADIYAHLMVGILGAPSLSTEEYVAYMSQANPRVTMYGLLGLFAPTGEYDSSRLVSIGSNRWTFRGALPTTIRLSSNWQPGKRTTLELIPIIDIFTDNNDPTLSSSRFFPDSTSQNPIFSLEVHLTHDLGEKFWGSLDTYYGFGGATYADGVGQNNQQSFLTLGGTLGANLWLGGTLTISGGGVVLRNDNSFDGWQVSAMLIQAF